MVPADVGFLSRAPPSLPVVLGLYLERSPEPNMVRGEALLESRRRLDGPQGPEGRSVFLPYFFALRIPNSELRTFVIHSPSRHRGKDAQDVSRTEAVFEGPMKAVDQRDHRDGKRNLQPFQRLADGGSFFHFQPAGIRITSRGKVLAKIGEEFYFDFHRPIRNAPALF